MSRSIEFEFVSAPNWKVRRHALFVVAQTRWKWGMSKAIISRFVHTISPDRNPVHNYTSEWTYTRRWRWGAVRWCGPSIKTTRENKVPCAGRSRYSSKSVIQLTNYRRISKGIVPIRYLVISSRLCATMRNSNWSWNAKCEHRVADLVNSLTNLFRIN